MSIQVYKCASVTCDNDLKKKPISEKSYEKFCYKCRGSHQVLRWKCKGCDNIICSNNPQKVWCTKECADKARKGKRKDYFKSHYESIKIIRKIKRLKDRKCRRCHGVLLQPYNKLYCTEYCCWLNYLRHRSIKIKILLESVK